MAYCRWFMSELSCGQVLRAKTLLALSSFLMLPPLLHAQSDESTQAPEKTGAPQETGSAEGETAGDPVQSLFPHSSDTRYWVTGQANFIFQTHPPFHAPYSGPNSLSPNY